jgi:membrane-bound lytic murein transglycosylase D
VTLRRVGSALLFSLFSMAVAAAVPTDVETTFPCSETMREGVEFWKSVWTRWTLQQVVLHDTDHPSIVYEVFELPPPVGEVYTDGQREFVKARREALQARLASVELKVSQAATLEDDEKALVLAITEVAGSEGLVGASQRVRSQRGLRERFRRGLEISGRYHDAFVAVFRDAGLPEDLADLPHVESSFQVAARSSAGAVGVWQFTRGAARKFMLMTPGLDERLDPVAAARGAARYLKTAYDALGSWPLAITSYNHGIEGMRVARDRFGLDFPKILDEYDGRTFGFASKNFYKEFLAAREIADDPAAYFPEGLVPDPPLTHDRVTIDRPTAVARIASRYGVSVAGLAAINPAWTTRALRGNSPLPAGTAIWLPEGTLERRAALARKSKAVPAVPERESPPVATMRP